MRNITFDQEKLSAIIVAYKKYFPSHWKDEMYKWEAVQHFQKYWDVNAQNFLDMFMEAKIFGELLMLIEKDYRGTKATLAYSSTTFSVPKNLYMIGMMNTADRSLAMIDYALRRRFSFYEMEPGFHSEGFKAYQASLQNETFNVLIEQIVELNREINADDSLGAGFRIGHSYFCGQKECTEEWMKSVVYYDIIPMLQEYWFDDRQKVQRWENLLIGVFND